MNKIYLLLCLLILMQDIKPLKFNFKKLVCNVTDPEYVFFEECVLKAVGRNKQFVKIQARLLHRPIIDGRIRLQIFKRANGWKPFLYDITITCDFLTKNHGVNKILWSLLKAHTNINHTCPYNEDVVELYRLNNTDVTSNILYNLPVPSGDYMLVLNFILEHKHRLSVNFYGTLY